MHAHTEQFLITCWSLPFLVLSRPLSLWSDYSKHLRDKMLYNPAMSCILHLSLNCKGRWGTTNDFTSSFLLKRLLLVWVQAGGAHRLRCCGWMSFLTHFCGFRDGFICWWFIREQTSQSVLSVSLNHFGGDVMFHETRLWFASKVKVCMFAVVKAEVRSSHLNDYNWPVHDCVPSYLWKIICTSLSFWSATGCGKVDKPNGSGTGTYHFLERLWHSCKNSRTLIALHFHQTIICSSTFGDSIVRWPADWWLVWDWQKCASLTHIFKKTGPTDPWDVIHTPAVYINGAEHIWKISPDHIYSIVCIMVQSSVKNLVYHCFEMLSIICLLFFCCASKCDEYNFLPCAKSSFSKVDNFLQLHIP